MQVAWSRADIVQGAAECVYTRVIVLPSGDVVVGGHTVQPNGTERGIVRRISASGNIVWTRTLSGPQGSSSLRVDQLALIPGGDILGTATGASGLAFKLAPGTGNVTGSRAIAEPTSASGIGPDYQTYFGSVRNRLVSTYVDPANYTNQTFHDVVLRRVSLNFAVQQSVAEAGYELDQLENGLPITRTQDPPLLKIAFTDGQAALMAHTRWEYDHYTQALDAVGYHTRVLSVNPLGNVVVSNQHSQSYPVGGLITLASLDKAFGVGVNHDGHLQFSYSEYVWVGPPNNFYFQTMGSTYDKTTGAHSLVSSNGAHFQTFRDQNGSRRSRGESHYGAETVAKSVPGMPTVFWTLTGAAASALPAKLLIANRSVFGQLVVDQYSDGTGLLEATLTTAETPSAVTEVTQTEANGFSYVVGSKLVGNTGAGWIVRVNQSPVAQADAYSVPMNGVLSGNSLIANDFFAVGLSPALVTGPTNGTVALAGNGTFTYTPNAGFVGTDTFTYSIQRTAGLAASTAVCTITVQ